MRHTPPVGDSLRPSAARSSAPRRLDVSSTPHREGQVKEFKLPDLGEGLTEAEIVQVLVGEGDEVKEDQPVLLVETEKAQVELPSPFGGRVSKINVRPGQRVKVGSVLMSFDVRAGGGEPSPPGPPTRGSATLPSGTPPTRGSATLPSGTPARSPALLPAATPATRRLARELGVDLADVAGSGPAGRITDEDVRSAAGRASG